MSSDKLHRLKFFHLQALKHRPTPEEAGAGSEVGPGLGSLKVLKTNCCDEKCVSGKKLRLV